MTRRGFRMFSFAVIVPVAALWSFGFWDTAKVSVAAMLPSFAGLHSAEKPAYTLLSTAYNSLPEQTDDTPFETATGEQTQPGIIALSRDLLEEIPYGSVVEIVDVRPRVEEPNGCGATMTTIRRMETYPGLTAGQFRVADTMHRRKTEQLDMWLEHYDDAIRWGRCEVTIVPVLIASR